MRPAKPAVATGLARAFAGLAATSTDGAEAEAATTGRHPGPELRATLAPYGPDSFALEICAPRRSPISAFTATEAICIDAGTSGQEDVTVVARTSKCPAGVSSRKPARKKR